MGTAQDDEMQELLAAARRVRLLNQVVEDLDEAAACAQQLSRRIAAHRPGYFDVTGLPVAVDDLAARTRAMLAQMRLHEAAVRRVLPAGGSEAADCTAASPPPPVPVPAGSSPL
jgi:hypothetical protein